jgi:CheY-like chemotaxis protein
MSGRRELFPREQQAEARSGSPRKNVLVVEDDPFAREALAVILGGEGYTVVTVGDGQEALSYLRRTVPPDLILLDLWLPGMDGWEFCRHRQREPGLAGIPLVVVSADDRLPAGEAASLGIAGQLQKPIVLGELLETIVRYC